MIKTYADAKVYLEQFIPTPQTAHQMMQLERIKYLCQMLGEPQTKYPIIHVAGTSGKGSTATFAATILKESGFKVGLHLSPHLESITERIQIDNLPLAETEFIKLVNEFAPIVAQTEVRLESAPSYFEILVAMSFLYFARCKVDAAVVEVGLGGKLDATNVIDPSLAILTNVSLDHTNILGKSVYAILKDKMGIIKKGAPAVVSGVAQPRLQRLLKKKCQSLNVPLYLLGRDFRLSRQPLLLPGDFQHENFSLAAKTGELFLKRYFPGQISTFETALKSAAGSAFIPGRLEVFSHTPRIILDGAHNRAKMTALVAALKKLHPRQKFISVVAVKQGKPAATLLKLLEPITTKFICTTFTQTTDTGLHASIPAQKLATLTRKPASVCPQSPHALQTALKYALNRTPILITGSLYLVGEIRTQLRHRLA